jgi:hypothetical protein
MSVVSTASITMSEKAAAAAAALSQKMHQKALEKAAKEAEKAAAKEAKEAEKAAAKAAKEAEKVAAAAEKAAAKEAKAAERAATKAAKEAEKAANPKRPRGRPAKSSASMVSSTEEDDMVSLSDGARPDLFEPAPYNTNRTAILARLHKAEAALASLRALLTA